MSPSKSPAISQATVAQMVRLFNMLTKRPEPHTMPIVANVKLELFEFDMPHDLLELFQGYGWNFQEILLKLHAGSFGEKYSDWRDQRYSQAVLKHLAEYLCTRVADLPDHLPQYKAQGANLLRQLELDGYTFEREQNKLIQVDLLPTNVVEAGDALTELLRKSSLPNRELIEQHYRNGVGLYAQSKWEPAISEWRKFYERLLRDIAEETAQQRSDVKKNTGTMKDVFEYLHDVGFFDKEERLAYGDTYRLLSSGTKPGLLPADLALAAMVQAVTIGTLLLKKYRKWRAGKFRFSDASKPALLK